MQYDTGKHCVFYHRYHLVWSTKYRFKVLTGRVRLRVRDICCQSASKADPLSASNFDPLVRSRPGAA